MISILRGVTLLVLSVCCISTHSVVRAHQQKEAYVTLLFNDRTSLVEISHRFSLHDAQHIVNSLGFQQSDLTTGEMAQTFFVKYIEGHFILRNAKQEILDLALVGHEVDDKYFWVYQEMPFPNTDSMIVEDTALFETWPKQINYVNIEKSDWVRSARLSKDKPYKKISLLD